MRRSGVAFVPQREGHAWSWLEPAHTPSGSTRRFASADGFGGIASSRGVPTCRVPAAAVLVARIDWEAEAVRVAGGLEGKAATPVRATPAAVTDQRGYERLAVDADGLELAEAPGRLGGVLL